MQLQGTAYERGDEGYEPARRATSWNARLPDRYPDLIVQAASRTDVVEAVRHAASKGYRVGVRSGGHSWSANHVRDGGLLLDVSRLNDVHIDDAERRAIVGPGCKGNELCLELDQRGLFFPAGHCKGVGLGGYLLQGGYGWNSRLLGPACESVLAVEVVTADGDVLLCDDNNHADLYWAARGSGPGFFGVVTAFHLRLHSKPNVCGSSLYVYPVEQADPVFRWARAISADIDPRVELQIVTSRSFPGLQLEQPAIAMASPVFADDEDQAREALSILDTCPALDDALVAVPYSPAELSQWYDAVMSNYPDGHRYAADNMWTSASADYLLPGIHRIIETLPPHPSHFLWLGWGVAPPRQDMAYSLEDEVYLALYGCWERPEDDARYADWARSNMEAMAPLATGIQLADENLAGRPARFASDEAMAKLDRLRAEYDGEGRFHSWGGRA